jgi:hypothetical protein
MKRLVPLVLVACSTGSAPDVAGVGSPPIVDDKPALTAAHGATIEILALADEGDAAVTQDAMGGTRLWPAFDGMRQPYVVLLGPAKKLSLGHVADGFVIAAVDEGGGGELVHVGESGRARARTSLAPEPPIVSVTVAPQGVIVGRSDHTLELLDPNGEPLGRLAADPGSRIDHVATRNGRTLVVFSRDGRAFGRWLDGIAWGANVPIDVTPRSKVALSPDGKHLLVDYEDKTHDVTYELSTETGKIVGEYRPSSFVGFVDDDTVGIVVGTELHWYSMESGDAISGGAVAALPPFVAGTPFAAGTGVIVGSAQTALVLHTKQWVQKLGYRMADVPSFRVLGDRILVAGEASTAALLDADLVQRGTIELPDDPWSTASHLAVADLVPIDERFVITTHSIGSMSWGLGVVDRSEKTTRTFQHALTSREIRYEPATQLLAVTDGVASYLTRWDGKAFATWYRLAFAPSDVHLVDPRQSNGIVAIGLRRVGSMVDIEEIHGDNLEVGAPIDAVRATRVMGVGVHVDRAGNAYVYNQGTLVVYRAGLEVRRIENVGSAGVAPHPSGTYVAAYGDQRIRMYDAAGTVRWEIAAPLAQRIEWLGGDLVVDFAGGLGKIDAATGALIQRSCGWTFGYYALSTNDVSAGESICDAH